MNKIEILAEQILQHKKDYYIFANPTISDDEYDLLEDELRELDPNHKVLKMTGIDIRNRNQWPVKDLSERMGSLNKVKSFSEYESWKKDYKKCYFNPKADGASIQLEYDNGILISAITRGNGFQGEDITQNVLKMKNVLRILPFNYHVILKGEIVVMLNDFNTYLQDYANPRNAAAGIAKSKDGKNTEHLTVLYYDATVKHNKLPADALQNFFETIKLQSIGIYDEKNLKEMYDKTTNDRNYYGFEIDGFVVKEYAPPVYKNNNPTNQIALKFPAQSAIGTVSEIFYKPTRTSRISVVAILKNSINVGGSNIKRISLGSWELMQKKKIFPGTIVEVIRANDVIPFISKVIDSSNAKKVTLQDVKNLLNNQNIYINGANLQLPEADNLNNLFNHISHIFNVLEIKGISGRSIEDIIEFYNIKSPHEIFDCDFDKLISKDGWGSSKIQILKQQLEDKSKITFTQLIQCLSITSLSSSRITEIVNTFQIKDLDELYKLNVIHFLQVNGIQDKLANQIYHALQLRKDLAYLLRDRLTLEEKTEVTSDELDGLSFCITGKTSMKRKEFQKLIESLGGKNVSINKAHYLITNDSDSGSSKNKTAEKLGIKIINEKEFQNTFIK